MTSGGEVLQNLQDRMAAQIQELVLQGEQQQEGRFACYAATSYGRQAMLAVLQGTNCPDLPGVFIVRDIAPHAKKDLAVRDAMINVVQNAHENGVEKFWTTLAAVGALKFVEQTPEINELLFAFLEANFANESIYFITTEAIEAIDVKNPQNRTKLIQLFYEYPGPTTRWPRSEILDKVGLYHNGTNPEVEELIEEGIKDPELVVRNAAELRSSVNLNQTIYRIMAARGSL